MSSRGDNAPDDDIFLVELQTRFSLLYIFTEKRKKNIWQLPDVDISKSPANQFLLGTGQPAVYIYKK